MAAKGVLCHLEVYGKPLCERPWVQRESGVLQCEYGTLTAARAAQRKLWKHGIWWVLVKVVRGPCPAAEAVFGAV